MAETAGVVIIGAGIQGLSAAYHLAAAGVDDVVVLEKEYIGAGSSGRSASMIMLQVGSPARVRMSQHCFAHYMAFEEEIGADPEYDPIGTLLLADHSVAEQERDMIEMRRSLGVELEVLTPEEIKKMVPEVNVEDLALGVWGPEDGVIEAQSIMLGYRDAARRLGASVRQGVTATGIEMDGDRVTAVQTSDGPIHTEWVVNAAGANAAQVAGWVGVELPLDVRSRSVYVTDEFPAIADDHPFTFDVAKEWYYRKEGPGVLIGMGKEKTDRAEMTINRRLLPEVIDMTIHRAPLLAEASIMTGWSGLRPLTPDYHPIVGPVDGLEGYVNLTGWGGEGVMHAPAGGLMVAEWISEGAVSTFDLEPFLLSRFAS